MDAKDIERVIQQGVPASFANWIQRAGRGARSADMKGIALLLVERSVCQAQASHRNPSGRTGDDDDSDVGEHDTTYRKTVDPSLCRWIETTTCRREVADQYFNNPPRADSEYL